MVTFGRWVHRHRKYMATGGAYVEKVYWVLDFGA